MRALSPLIAAGVLLVVSACRQASGVLAGAIPGGGIPLMPLPGGGGAAGGGGGGGGGPPPVPNPWTGVPVNTARFPPTNAHGVSALGNPAPTQTAGYDLIINALDPINRNRMSAIDIVPTGPNNIQLGTGVNTAFTFGPMQDSLANGYLVTGITGGQLGWTGFKNLLTQTIEGLSPAGRIAVYNSVMGHQLDLTPFTGPDGTVTLTYQDPAMDFVGAMVKEIMAPMAGKLGLGINPSSFIATSNNCDLAVGYNSRMIFEVAHAPIL